MPISIEQSGMSIEAANGMGSLLLEEVQLAAERAQSEAEISYGISDIEVTGTVADVKLHVAGDCTAVVGIYEEKDEKPFAFGYAAVSQRKNRAEVKIEADNMPEYFIVKGYIVETDSLRPLSKEYCSSMYTKAMQDFLKKTAADFDSDKVVNLDEDNKTNFAVVGNDNVLICTKADTDGGIVNELVSYDEGTNTYTFANADESLTNLEAEDIFVYQCGENDILIIKVKSLQKQTAEEKTTVDITAYSDELDAEDVFQYVKIEETTGTADASEIDSASCPEGVTYLGRDTAAGYAIIEGEKNVSITLDAWQLDLKVPKKFEGSVEGNIAVSFGIEAKVKYYLDASLLDLFNTVWYVDISITGEVGIEGEIKAEGKLAVPLCSGVETKGELFILSYIPKFVIGASFDGVLGITGQATLGIKLGNRENGLYFDKSIDILNLSAELQGYIGVDFNPQIEVKNIINAELDTGVHFGIEISADGRAFTTETEKHDCGFACISGDFFFDVPFEGRLKILKLKELKLDEKLGVEGSKIKITVGKFYYSIKHHEFGFGECPYNAYKITVVVKTINKKPAAGAKVNNEATTDKKGAAKLWLPGGRQKVYASYNGETGSASVEIDGAKQVEVILGIYAALGDDAVMQVSLGVFGSSAAVTKDGSLYVWGDNANGQLGTGGTDKKKSPVKLSLNDVSMVTLNTMTNNRNSVAITKDGSLYTWGNNSNAALGNGTTDNQYEPKKILSDIKDVSMGYFSGGAIANDGSLYMWGLNNVGQLGTNTNLRTPVKILEDEKIANVCWGYDGYFGYSAALTKDGKLYMMGSNRYGQLGNGKTTNLASSQPEQILSDEKVEQICLSTRTGCSAAITEGGKLYMWGYNYCGQLGNGTTADQTTPVKILENVKVKEAAVSKGGGYTSAAITEDGSLYMWGRNLYGRLGIGTTDDMKTVPTKVKGLEKVKAVSLGYYNNAAITEDGSLYMWGYNNRGQLGDGTLENKSVPVKILDNVAAVNLEDTYSAAVTVDGSLWMWGYNNTGQLGNGSTSYTPVTTPQKVVFPTDTAPASYALEAEEPYKSAEDSPSITTDAANPARQTAVFSGLEPSDLYNVYVMKSKEDEDRLSPANLLYITQAVSGADGNLSVTYEMREAYDNPAVFCVGYTQTDLSAAEAILPDITYDGEEHLAEPTVIFNGQTLAAGTDYEVYGDCAVTEIGEYKIVIKGIGICCGEKEVTFRVKEAGSDPDPDEPGGDDPDKPGDDPDKPGDDPERDDVLPGDIPSNGVIPEGLWIAGVDETGYGYTAAAIKPEVRVYDHKTLLKEKTDYAISYKNNLKANDAADKSKAPTITVTGKGNYAGKDTKTFKILPLDIGATDAPASEAGADAAETAADVSEATENIFEADDIAITANGKEQKPIPTLLWNGRKLKNNTDYTYTYHEGTYAGTDTKVLNSVKAAGNYYIKLTGKGNYTGVRRLKLTLLAAASGSTSGTAALKPISKASVTKIPSQSYQTQKNAAGKVEPELTVNDGNNKLTKGVNYEVSYSNNTKPGTAYAIITGKEDGGYSGTKRVSFKITGVAISKAKVTGLSGQTFTYSSMDITPALSLSVKQGGKDTALVCGTDYSIKWQNNHNAGTATVIFTGKNGYTGVLKKTFKIKPFNIAENQAGLFYAELKSDSVPYAKGGARPGLTVTFQKADGTKQTLKEGTDYTVTYKNNKALNDGSSTSKLPAVTIKGKGSFTGIYKERLTYKITPQDISKLTLTAADKTYQNKTNIYPTKVTITDVDGKALKAGTDYDKHLTYTYKTDTTLEDGTIRKAGAAVDKSDILPAGAVINVTAAPKGNYTGTSLTGEYSIMQYDISAAKVTIAKQTYTGRAITLDKADASQISVKVKGQKLDPSQYEIVAGSYKNNVKKGTAAVTLKGIGNYGGTKTVKFTIKAKGFLWWTKP